MYYASAFKFTEMNPSFLCGISNVFVLGKRWGMEAAERGTNWKGLIFFSITIARLKDIIHNG